MMVVMIWFYLGVMNMVVSNMDNFIDIDKWESHRDLKRKGDLLSWVPVFNLVLLAMNGYFLLINIKQEVHIYLLCRRNKRLTKEFEALERKRREFLKLKG